jgi:DNA-binding XRE family transcriptional regulator
MASIFGISNSTIALYETGDREPNLRMINRLADFFEITADYLLGRVDNPKMTEEDLERALDNIPNLYEPHNKELAMEKVRAALKIKKLTLNGKPIPEDKAKRLISQLESYLNELERST